MDLLLLLLLVLYSVVVSFVSINIYSTWFNNKKTKTSLPKEDKTWDEIIAHHNPFADLEEDEDLERINDLIDFLKTNYHPPVPKPYGS